MNSHRRIFLFLTLAAGFFAAGMAVGPLCHRWGTKVHAAGPPAVVEYGCKVDPSAPVVDSVVFVDASPKPFPYALPSVGSDCAAAGTLLMSEGLSQPNFDGTVAGDFSRYGQQYQAIQAESMELHSQFVSALNASGPE